MRRPAWMIVAEIDGTIDDDDGERGEGTNDTNNYDIISP